LNTSISPDPTALYFGEKVDKARRQLGKNLAEESPCDADIVIAIPDSANTAALGYAQASGIHFEIGSFEIITSAGRLLLPTKMNVTWM
jgi:glutamine phosphoribosylpyrophosphate amidotransferase